MASYKVNLIGEIRTLLRDRYKEGFPIIKEIVQNADDSGAQKLDFGWTTGLPTAKHALLQRPALFFLNNGEFTRSNQQSFLSFGMDDRAGQKATIGKFGLGQKSVFHLCDAFFFLGASQSEDFEIADFLNPWEDTQGNDSKHPNWGQLLESDASLIKDYLKKLILEPAYFILWIPLRKKTDQSIIVKEFLGDKSPQELFLNDLATQIGVLLPLLRSLKEIQYWLPDSQDNLTSQFHLLLEGSRRIYPSEAENEPIEDCQFNGNLLDKISGQTLQFAGRESILSILEDEEKLKPFFPQHETEDGETVPDKSIPHCAVTFTQKPASFGTLSIQWAVFLPVGQSNQAPNEEIILTEGNRDFILLLHGYFFLDSGRSKIETWEQADLNKTPENESEACQQWNKLLATKGTLKQVLPALNLFIKKHHPAPQNIWSLSYALKHSNLFQKYANDICHKSQWVYCYAADEQEWQWQYIDSKKPLLAIPQHNTDQTSLLAWEVLPNLLESESLQDCLITLIEAPNLSLSSSDWSETQLEAILQNVPIFFVFQNQQRLEYLLDFLRQCANTLCDEKSIQDRLCDIARQAFARFNLNKLYQFKDLVISFLNFIPDKCFFIKCKTYQAKIFLALHKLDTHVLLIPKLPKIREKSEHYFDFSAIKIKQEQGLNEGEALIILEKLNSLIQNEEFQDIIDDCADIAREILLLVVDKKSFVDKHPDLRVLRAHNCRSSQDKTTVSLKDIISAYEERTLFRHKLSNKRREFANPLQSILSDATVIIIEVEIVELLSHIVEKNKIVPCDAVGCLMALSHGPSLNPHIAERAELLKKLLGADLDDKRVFSKGIRYLLTLQIEPDLEDKHALWYLASSEHNPFFQPILTARAESRYLINDVFVPSVINNLAPAKQNLIGIEELKPVEAIKLALSYNQPHLLCHSILDALEYIDIDSFPASEKQELRQKAWLIDEKGTPIKPEEVVYLPEIKDRVSHIIGEQTELCYWDYLRLELEIRTHSSFPKLHEDLAILAVGREGLKILGLILMDQDEKYRLGDFTPQSFKLDACHSVFDNLPAKLLPAWEIIKIAQEKYRFEVWSLLSQLFGQFSITRLKDLLLWLKTQHTTNNSNHSKILEVFNSYLTTAIAHPQFNQIFPELYFLSQTRKWKLPSQLVNEAQVSADYLLHSQQAEILNAYLKTHSHPSTLIADPTEQTLKLAEYFRDWEGLIVNDEMIGVFFALLGNNPLLGDDSKIRELANNYLKNYTVDDIRIRLTGDHDWIDRVDNYWIDNFEIHSAQHGDGEVQLTALDGSAIFVALSQQTHSLIISCNPVQIDKISNKRQIEMQLRIIDSTQYQSAELSYLLKNSIETLLHSIHRQKDTEALDKLWEKLSQTEQLDIDIARQMILENALFYLRQLGLKNPASQINHLLTEWDKTRRRKEELGTLQYSKKRQETIAQLAQFIEKDEQEKTEIFEAVRATLQKYQYTSVGVPFELFQNADDAVVELEELEGILSEKSKRFILKWDENHLTIVHWGRKINRFRSPSFSGSKGEERGFDRDLEKMLLLSISDKSSTVTGKFGLGFKSVFLICQQPQILSGKMGFKIAAGMLPIPLKSEEKENLPPWKSDDFSQATIIKLPFNNELNDTPNHVVAHFSKLIGIQLAFSKRIKHCLLDSPNSQYEISWQPTEILKDISIGDFKLNIEQETKSKALLIENQQWGAILIALDSKGCCQLPHYEEIPDIWVTAPLQESNKMVFAINGPFQIDVGRSRLASDSEYNLEIAKKLGFFIGQKLCELFKHSKQSDFNFHEKLGLAVDISDYDFWDSVWNLLAESGLDNENPFIMNMLGHFNTIGQLINQYPAFPNGLWGKYRVLNDVKNITHVASGILNEERCFKVVLTWPLFQQEIPPEKIASSRKWAKLKKLIPFEESALTQIGKAFYLADAVELEMGESQKISPKLAKQLGQLISCYFLDELDEQDRAEHNKLLEVLGKARFQAKEGQYHLVSDLCERRSDDIEESEQTAFAFNNVLSSNYTDKGVTFFKACRRQYERIEWVEMAEQFSIPTLQSLVTKDQENREQLNIKRTQKATNKKIGENVELIIKQILRGKGLNIKTIYIGGDFEIWPKENVGWDSGQIQIFSNTVYTVEVKFTSGSKVHLSKLQSKTARDCKSKYIVLVVEGYRYGELRELLKLDIDDNSVSEDLKDLIKTNSHVVKELYENLGELPNPNEIEPDIQGYWLKKPLWENNEDMMTWLENEF